MQKPLVTFDCSQSSHTAYGHPENHARLEAVMSHLSNSGLLSRLDLRRPEAAPREAVERVHKRLYLGKLQSARSDRTIWLDPDTYYTPESLDIAFRAAGGGILCVDEVVGGSYKYAFALPRPPGHHATPTTAMGFCLINHIAVAVRHLMYAHQVNRVAVVDFDVHHGNGTQEAFYNDPNVLFLSVHESPLFPGTGPAHERGGPDAQGTNINVPLPAGCGDTIFLEVFHRIFEPAIASFKPEFILVSVGYDAHWRDPLANMQMTIGGFAALIRKLHDWADTWSNGKMVFFLEGGYDLKALPLCVSATLQLLIDRHSEIIDPVGDGGFGDRRPGNLLKPFVN